MNDCFPSPPSLALSVVSMEFIAINYLSKNGLGSQVIVFRLYIVVSAYQEPGKYSITSWLS